METKYNVLVLDDDPGVIETYKTALDEFPEATVLTAQNRREAQEIVDQFTCKERDLLDPERLIAVAFIDQNLGDYDPEYWNEDREGAEGIAMVRHIKRNVCPLTRVHVITAYAGTPADHGFPAAKNEADGYISKLTGGGLIEQVPHHYRSAAAGFKEAVELHNLRIKGESEK